MFSAATLVILNKTDLLPHLDFSVEQAIANVRRVNPNATMLQISARTGEGLDAWFAWIRGQTVEARQFGFV
jgi:hydrogenase nickel incorporation protein HypB